MKTSATKTWCPTRHDYLYRHNKSKTYYARLTIDGKKTWRSLQTTVLEIALSERDKLLEDSATQNELGPDAARLAGITSDQALVIREAQIKNDPSVKSSTRHYWNQLIAAMRKSWPELLTMELRKITTAQCEAWAGKASRQMSPTRFNNSLSLLKTLFSQAIKNGVRRTNPAAEIKRVKVRHKDLSSRLPSKKKFAEWIAAIRSRGGRFSKDSAEFVEFLAYTGMRTSEAKRICWKNCDFEKGEILVEGDPEEGTKNGEFRRIPMIPAAKSLLTRIEERRDECPNGETVLRVGEAQKSMDMAGKLVGVARITHHDLRHFFATICIESGVDIPTVARWLGHKDGGVLALKTYGHLRNEHSLAAASRVSFDV